MIHKNKKSKQKLGLYQPLGETKISLTKFDGNAPTLPPFIPIHQPSSICCVDSIKKSEYSKEVRETMVELSIHSTDCD